MGMENESATTLLGYAMDGFPIYGHLDDPKDLDPCNGIENDDGSYQYHVRSLDQIDEDLEYCNGNSPETNWNYILGCYSGSVLGEVFDSTTYELDNDCFIDGSPTEAPAVDPTEAPTVYEDTIKPKGLNFIIMQPDDLQFFDNWSPPPNSPKTPNKKTDFPPGGLPNIEKLRLNGLQMKQAYTTSPQCGTSRYSTITGKYPSRALSNPGGDPSEVTIPLTKLQDADCSEENMAAQFQDNGYRTAMIGKS